MHIGRPFFFAMIKVLVGDEKDVFMAKKKEKEVFSPEDWLDVTIARAVQVGASDVHIEPMRDRLMVRFRVDGELQFMGELPSEYSEVVVARIKILGQLDSAEHRIPQDGHARIELPATKTPIVDIRISLFPTLHGETAVLRILSRSTQHFGGFADHGMAEDHIKIMEEVIQMPFGMVLATGPTGSGKTSLLYTALALLEKPERNIVTLEDPIERQFTLIRQAQITGHGGLTFASGLRSILRQDPDVVMIGEIRDQETAEISFRAALTGRLLFSTLHTKDTIGAVTRLLDFGIPRSVMSSALRIVVNQRLIRLVCTTCTQTTAPKQNFMEEAAEVMDISNAHFVAGGGCDECGGMGYKGRISIFEILQVGQQIEQAILEGKPVNEMRRISLESGMRTLRGDAVLKAAQGLITLADAIHMTAM